MKKFLFLFALILLSLPVMGAPQVTIQSVQDVISLGETAHFKLSITDPQGDDYRLYYGGVEWDVPPQSFSIQRGETRVIDVSVRPLYVAPGQHAIPVTLKSRSSDQITQVLLIVNVRGQGTSSYLPSIGINVDMPSSVKPGEEFLIDVELTNRNPLGLEDLQLHIDSDFFLHIENFSLSPTSSNETGTAKISQVFFVSNTFSPQQGSVVFRIVYRDETVGLFQKSLIVERYDPPFEVQKSTDKSFFKRVDTITITNIGNVEKLGEHREELSVFKSVVTSTQPSASVLKEDGTRFLRWQLTLAPGESEEVKVVTNYRLIILLLVIALLAVGIYFFLRSPLAISKRAEVIKTEEGGISMLKVMLIVKNISGKPVHDVKLYDRIPSLADYFKEEQVGTLSPSSVQKSEQKGTMLKYEINTLDAFEERIILYKIRTQLNILGGLTLPAVQGRFKSDSGRNRITKSSNFKLLQ